MAAGLRFRGKGVLAPDAPQVHGDQCAFRRRSDCFGHVVFGRQHYVVRRRGNSPGKRGKILKHFWRIGCRLPPSVFRLHSIRLRRFSVVRKT